MEPSIWDVIVHTWTSPQGLKKSLSREKSSNHIGLLIVTSGILLDQGLLEALGKLGMFISSCHTLDIMDIGAIFRMDTPGK